VMAAASTRTASDPARAFFIDDFIDPTDYGFVVIADSSPLLFTTIAVGALVLGPPPPEPAP